MTRMNSNSTNDLSPLSIRESKSLKLRLKYAKHTALMPMKRRGGGFTIEGLDELSDALNELGAWCDANLLIFRVEQATAIRQRLLHLKGL